MWVLWRSSRERPENVQGTSRINLPGKSLERQIRTFPGRHFRMSPGCSNRTVRGCPGDVGGGRPRDVMGTNICRLGNVWLSDLLIGNTPNLCCVQRSQLAWKVRYTLIIPYVLITVIFGENVDLQRKGKVSQDVFLGVVETVKVTENSPPMKILHGKDLMVIQECPHDV